MASWCLWMTRARIAILCDRRRVTSPVPEPGLPVGLPFLFEDALAVGLSAEQLRSSSWHRLFRGVYVSASVPMSVQVLARGALLLHPPTAHASHATAAALCG